MLLLSLLLLVEENKEQQQHPAHPRELGIWHGSLSMLLAAAAVPTNWQEGRLVPLRIP
jgi:hypothetical protein